MIGNAEVKRNLKSELGFNEDAFLIGFSGRFTEIKNLKMLLRVVEALHSRARKDFGLVMIGDGHLRNELEKESKSSMSGECVSFIGVVDNPFEIIGALDCVALCSLNEGTPLSLLEAMAMGKAVVSTEVGGVPDILGSKVSEKNGVSVREHGLGVSSGDVEAFANALEMLMDDRQLRADLGSRAKEFVDREYSKERLVSDIKQLYRGLFGRGA
jgi:glycosyltransferase involved in cell wall biosynthesis